MLIKKRVTVIITMATIMNRNIIIIMIIMMITKIIIRRIMKSFSIIMIMNKSYD